MWKTYQFAVELSEEVCPNIDELSLNLRVPLHFWLPFAAIEWLLRSHTSDIAPSSVVTMAVIVTAATFRHGMPTVTATLQNVKCESFRRFLRG